MFLNDGLIWQAWLWGGLQGLKEEVLELYEVLL